MKKKSLILGLGLITQALLAEPVKPPIHVEPITPVIGPIVKKTYHLSASEFAQELDRLLATAGMKMNNHQVQSSFVQVRGVQLLFQIARTVVDIDCGTFCPDLGDGHFYVNDINLERADFRLVNGTFELSLDFEDSGREIKGYHSALGDNGMPDFQMDRPLIRLTALPSVSNSQMSLSFSNSRLTADIESTGGCNIGGIDICNRIFGTDRKIEKAVEAAAQNALNGGLIQTALKAAIRSYLQSKGITAPVRSIALVGNDLRVTVQ